MKIIDHDTAIKIFNPPQKEELEKFLNDQGYFCSSDENDIYTGNYALSCAVYWARKKHPDANEMDIASFAGLIQGYTSGFWGGFNTDDYPKEKIIRNIILAVHGGTPAHPDDFISFIPQAMLDDSRKISAEHTERIIGILDHCYFGNLVEAVSELIEESTPEIAAGILIAMASTAAEYKETCQTASDFLKRKKTIGDLRKSVKKIASRLDWIKTSILLEIPTETLDDLRMISSIEKRNYYHVAEDILRVFSRKYLDQIINKQK